MRLLVRVLPLCLALALAVPAAAGAQPPRALATPPTRGALYQDGQTNRYLLGGTWLYRADPQDAGLAQGWWRDGSTDGWSMVSVPNAYNAGDFTSQSMEGSVGWYRRDFVLPDGAFPPSVRPTDRRWIVRFESVNYRATVWLNGRRLGRHAGAYLPFEFVLTHLKPGVNTLVVRVDDRRVVTDLPPGNGGQLSGGGNAGGWWNFGGLLREVYLRPVAGADISQAAIVPLLRCPRCGAVIQERVAVRNLSPHQQLVRLRGGYGTQPVDFGQARIAPGGTWTATALVPLAHPRLWEPPHPYLYRATLTLTDSRGRSLGDYLDYSGVRSITVTPDGRLRLNGRLLNLRGVDLHEQNIQTGAALSSEQLAQLMGWVRQLGARVIRSHYPLNPRIEEMADRDGILIWSEIPVYHVPDQYLTDPRWLANAHQFLRQNVLTNQNHPSILLWSVGNELTTPAGRREAHYIAGAAALAHQLDPTRPVGMATSGWPGVPCQSAYTPLDVVGHNEYFGWFDAGGGSNDDRDGLSPYLDSLRACYPHQAIMVSEFGFDGNRDGPVEERGTYQFQSNTVAFHLGVFASKPWLSGAVYWLLQDFAAFPGWTGGNPRPDPPFVQKGLVDLAGKLKPAWSVVSQTYHSTRQIGGR